MGISESTTAMGVDVASTKWHLVLASAVWAALVWPVTRLHNGNLGLDIAKPWTWVTVTDVERWFVLPSSVCSNNFEPNKYGFLCLRPAAAPLPLVVAAMVRTGPERLLVWQRKALCQHFGCNGNETVEQQETSLCAGLLAGHPDVGSTMAALESARNNTNTIEAPLDLEALTAAAFQEMDAENQEQFKVERDKYKQAGTVAQRLAAEVLKAARQNANAEEEADDHDQTTAPSKELDMPLADLAKAGVPDADRADCVRSAIPFVRPFVPGGPGTMDLPTTVVECRVNRVERTQTWVARYQSEDPVPQGAKVSKELQQVSKSKVFIGNKGSTEHQAFQLVVSWLWQKHRVYQPKCDIPGQVARVLLPCQHCEARAPSCPTWAAVQAGELTTTAKATPSRADTCLGSASAKTSGPAPQASTTTGRHAAAANTAAREATPSRPGAGLASASTMAPTPRALTTTASRQAAMATPSVLEEHRPGLTSARTRPARGAWPHQSTSPAPVARNQLVLNASEGNIIQVPCDGNCLFTCMAVGALLSRGSQPSTDRDKMDLLGIKCRRHFLKWVNAAMANGTTIHGESLLTWLVDPALHPGISNLGQYLQMMETWGDGQHQWGGFPEVCVLCTMWGEWAVLLQETPDAKTWAVQSWVGSAQQQRSPICILRCQA